jgi:hypothetical protein
MLIKIMFSLAMDEAQVKPGFGISGVCISFAVSRLPFAVRLPS